jgi:hypothetical protein
MVPFHNTNNHTKNRLSWHYCIQVVFFDVFVNESIHIGEFI